MTCEYESEHTCKEKKAEYNNAKHQYLNKYIDGTVDQPNCSSKIKQRGLSLDCNCDSSNASISNGDVPKPNEEASQHTQQKQQSFNTINKNTSCKPNPYSVRNPSIVVSDDNIIKIEITSNELNEVPGIISCCI